MTMDIQNLRLELIKICYKVHGANEAVQNAKILEQYILETQTKAPQKGTRQK
jgi:hypothetical protein